MFYVDAILLEGKVRKLFTCDIEFTEKIFLVSPEIELNPNILFEGNGNILV